MSYSHSGDGEDMEEIFEGMSYGVVQVLGGFQLSTDDPRNYTDRLAIISQERYFPTENYPVGADPEYHVPFTEGLAHHQQEWHHQLLWIQHLKICKIP